jgi:hypothetical protein
MKIIGIITLFVATPLLLCAARLKPESYYQKIAAEKYGGETEVTMPDGTRCDIGTEKHAIEVDFADKWAEAIGQSLNYAFQSNKKPAIILIMEMKEDERHFIRLGSIIQYYRLEIELIPFRAYLEIH